MAKANLKKLADGFSLLSDPTRLGILKELTRGPKNVTALRKAVKKKQPTMSHHLGLLRVGGLVRSKRQGRSVEYEAHEANLKALSAALAKLMPK
jgi:ArsR family transcriptional regulator